MVEVDLEAVACWMDSEGLPPGPVTNARAISGGTQNIMVRFYRGGEEFVLRRGPRHLRPRTNENLLREVRVLDALAGTTVPCPQLVAACIDETVLDGAVFYLMEPVKGFNATVELPKYHKSSDAVRHNMGLSAVDAIAALHALDPAAVGLGDVGRPDGFLERQAARWLSELESYARYDGYSAAALPNVADIGAWLDGNVPAASATGLVHGDYHLANMMFSDNSPDVAAIVDWEMWTVGDPLLDLAWLLVTWPEGESFAASGALGRAGGLPTSSELIDRYASLSDRDLSRLGWYEVLACFKLGIIIEGTYARAHAGKADKATGELLHAGAVNLFARAERMIAGEGERAVHR